MQITNRWRSGSSEQTVRIQQVQCLEKLASQGATSAAVGQLDIVHRCQGLFQPAAIATVWGWLPVRYVQDRDGDHWQRVEETLRQGTGDCEDWSILLAAVLKRLGIDARIGVMPNHAAVFIPVSDVDAFSVLLGQIDQRTLIPANWPLLNYAGGRWLPLEATVAPEDRGLPGDHLTLVAPAARQGTLLIAVP